MWVTESRCLSEIVRKYELLSVLIPNWTSNNFGILNFRISIGTSSQQGGGDRAVVLYCGAAQWMSWTLGKVGCPKLLQHVSIVRDFWSMQWNLNAHKYKCMLWLQNCLDQCVDKSEWNNANAKHLSVKHMKTAACTPWYAERHWLAGISCHWMSYEAHLANKTIWQLTSTNKRYNTQKLKKHHGQGREMISSWKINSSQKYRN